MNVTSRYVERSLIRFLLAMASLASFSGGPLILTDLLKLRLGLYPALGVCFLPVLLMMMGAQTMTYSSGVYGTSVEPTDIRLVRLGLFGSMVTLALHGYGVFIFATTASFKENHPLSVIGLILGIPIAIGIVLWSKQWLRRFVPPDDTYSPLHPS